MRPDDLEAYAEYIDHVKGQEGLRLILAYPDDYIDLLHRVHTLEADNKRLKQLEFRYIEECHARMASDDKLRYLRDYLRREGISIPNFKW